MLSATHTPPLRDADEGRHHQSRLLLLAEDQEDSDSDSPRSVEKDETEQELERMVFGDETAFRESLRELREPYGSGADSDGGLEGVEDADLFFTDLAPAEDPYLTSITDRDISRDAEDSCRSKQPPAWEDTDDERVLVSLESVPRLRKLRRLESEDVVSGKEYSRRLRQQFESLHPRPSWAQYSAVDGPPRKTRKRNPEGAETSLGAVTSEDETTLEPDTAFTTPLSELLQGAVSLIRGQEAFMGKKRKLRPEVISIQRTREIGGIQPSAITSLSFHPEMPLLLSSGPSSTLYLHHIVLSLPAPTPNPLLTSMHVRGTPLTTTAFHPSDGRIFLSARRRYFHIWHLDTGEIEKISSIYGQQHHQRTMERFKLSPCGRYMALLGSAKKGGGVINILSADSLQWTGQVRIESQGGVADFCWWREGDGLCIAGKSGEMTEWSMTKRCVIARWQDEGAVGTTVMSLGGQHDMKNSPVGSDRWLATGSSSGIVNVYDRRSWLVSSSHLDQFIPSQPKPLKVLDHLTTPTSDLTFTPDGQLLAMASRWKRDALRLVHLPSCTVFRNWPTSSTPLGRITAVAFAPGEIFGEDVHSLLAVANEQGKIRLWEIR